MTTDTQLQGKTLEPENAFGKPLFPDSITMVACDQCDVATPWPLQCGHVHAQVYSREYTRRAADAGPRHYFCSCGGALTAEEYIVHYFEMGHDRAEGDPSVGKFIATIADGLRHSIRDHGDITKERIGSAAKRVWGRIRDTWYDPFRPHNVATSDSWRGWFSRLGDAATTEVVSATANLVTDERLAALADAGILRAPAATASPAPAESANNDLGYEQWSRLDNWPVSDVLNKLVEATEHLLRDHNCDEQGHETWKYAAEAARKHVASHADNWQYTHEHDAELIRKDGMMCEAHPGLEFGHDPDCGGPGMAWVIEGRGAIKLLENKNTTRAREVAIAILERLNFDTSLDLVQNDIADIEEIINAVQLAPPESTRVAGEQESTGRVVAGRIVDVNTHGEPTRARLKEIETSVGSGYESQYRKSGWSKALQFALDDLHFLLTFFRDDVTSATPADNDAESSPRLSEIGVWGAHGEWPLTDVLTALTYAVEHLLQDHDCDRHGYEQLSYAIPAARWYVERLTTTKGDHQGSVGSQFD